MPYDVYKILHILGLTLVVMSLGGVMVFVINGGAKATNTFRKGIAVTHGIGLLLLLVAGFGMLAKLGLHGMPPLWAMGKIVIWLALGAFVAVGYKSPNLAKKGWIAVPVLVLMATALAFFKVG